MSEGAARSAQPEASDARARFASGLSHAVLDAEKHHGRSFDRGELAKRLRISRASLYAYLNGTTLPSSQTLDRLLTLLGTAGPETGQLATLRDDAEIAQRLRRPRPATGAVAPDGGVAVASAYAGETSSLAVPAHPRPVPRQLPGTIRDFVGRAAETAALDALALPPAGVAPARVLTITGTAGVGKTTLAVHWAHRIADRFPDGQLYANLNGFGAGAPRDPAAALHAVLLALGVGPNAIPEDLESRAALLRTLLTGRRVLVVLDNARSAEQARPLLPGSAGCLAVVTSRIRLEGLVVRDGASLLTLEELPHDAAVALLARRLGMLPSQHRPELDELARQCAHLPLTLSVAGARAAARSPDVLGKLVADLRHQRSRLDVLGSDDADLDLRTVLRWSYEPLSAPAARLFRLLGLHPGPDIDRGACAALLGEPDTADQALRGLVAAHLVTEHRPGRYTSHDLLRGFAQELAARLDAAQSTAAVARLLEYYLDAAQRANGALQPWVTYLAPAVTGAEPEAWPASVLPVPLSGATPTGGPSNAPTSYDTAIAWFENELPVLLALLETAAGHGFESHVWRLAWTLMLFLRRTGRRAERAGTQQLALDAAERAGHRHARAASRRKRADALAGLGRTGDAESLLALALTEFEALSDRDGARHVHLSYARLYEATGRHNDALEHARQALTLSAGDTANPLAVADCQTQISVQLCHLARHDEALSHGRRALDLYSRIGHQDGQANILRYLGRAEGNLGRHDTAIGHYERSRQLDHQLGDRFWEAQVMDHLADEYLACGDGEAAERWRNAALVLLESLAHPGTEAIRAKAHRARADGTAGCP